LFILSAHCAVIFVIAQLSCFTSPAPGAKRCNQRDCVKKCTEHEVHGARPKKSWTEVAEKDCQEDAMDRSR